MANVTTPVTSAVTTPAATSVGGGTTIVVDPVVAKIAGIAAREVPGVHALGGGAARLIGSVRDVIGSTDHGQGIKVEVGERQVAADVTIVVDYPAQLQVVANNVRSAISEAITRLVGKEVAEINVTVTDVYIPGQDDDTDSEPARVV